MAENQILTAKLAKTSNVSYITALIGSNASLLILDQYTRKIYFKRLISSVDDDIMTIETTQNIGLPSLVSCSSGVGYATIGSQLPLLVQLSDIHLDLSLEESIRMGDGDDHIYSLNPPINDALGLFNLDHAASKPSRYIIPGSSDHMNVTESPSLENFRRNFTLVSLSSDVDSPNLEPFIDLNSFIKYLPSDQITHIDCTADGETLIFATASSVLSFTSQGTPIAKSQLLSSTKQMLLISGMLGSNEGCAAILSENGSLHIYGLPKLDLLHSSALSDVSALITAFMPESSSESLLLLHKTALKNESSFMRSYNHSILGHYSIINLSRLLSSNQRDSSMVDAVQNGLNARKNGSNSSGAESLANALEGRLLASKASLDEIQQRLDDKKHILSRAILVLSRLSMDTSPDTLRLPVLNIPFAIEHDLQPIIGPSSKPVPEDDLPSLNVELGDRIEASSGMLVYADRQYLLQFTMENHSKSKVARARNLVGNADGALCQSTLLHCPEIPPNASGIVSASITIDQNSSMDPYVDISFLLEIGWRDANPPSLSTAPMQAFLSMHAPTEPEWKLELLALGKTRLDPYPANAFSGLTMRPVLTLPLCPYSTSLLATSDVTSTEAPIQNFLASRLRQLDAFGDIFHNSNTGLVVKTYPHGGTVCIEIGAMESEDEILRLIQGLYRYFDGLELEGAGSSNLDLAKGDERSALKLTENTLNPDWVSRCRRLIASLKYEIQLSICMKQLLSESTDADQAYFAWKRQFAEAQSATDLAASFF